MYEGKITLLKFQRKYLKKKTEGKRRILGI